MCMVGAEECLLQVSAARRTHAKPPVPLVLPILRLIFAAAAGFCAGGRPRQRLLLAARPFVTPCPGIPVPGGLPIVV